MSSFGRDLPALEPGPTRTLTLTRKISGSETGFKGSVFLHVDFTPGGVVAGVRLSESKKDGGTLDRLLHRIGDEVTDALKEIAETKERL